MFLFHKRTKNVIKWFWGIFATLVILSMVFTYSGFTMLARTTPSTAPQEIPPEVLAELRAQQERGTSTLSDETALNASGTVEVTTPTIERADTPVIETPPAPDAPPLQFSL